MTELRCDWNGVFPAAVTPFTPEGKVDEGSLRLLIDLHRRVVQSERRGALACFPNLS